MKVTLEVETENVVIDSLKEDYKMLYKSNLKFIKEANEKGVKFFQVEDYMNNKEILEHIRGVLEFYMIRENYLTFMSEMSGLQLENWKKENNNAMAT